MSDAMIRGVLACSVLLAVAFLVSGCAGSAISEAEQQSMAAAATGPAKLQPGDKVRLNVYGEDRLSGEYQIDQSGQISLPLAGTVEAQGLTQTELEQALAKKFRSEYLKNPKVTVTIATLQPYYMMGEVTKPHSLSLVAPHIEQAVHQFRSSGGARPARAIIPYLSRSRSYPAM
jgi:polysaccharide biosynthesis/export protein